MDVIGETYLARSADERRVIRQHGSKDPPDMNCYQALNAKAVDYAFG
jgi:hypothetical protein